MKICNLYITIREYIAIHSINSLPMKDLILKAKDTNYQKLCIDAGFALYVELVGKYAELKDSTELAIMSSYEDQVDRIREKLQAFGAEPKKLVDIINTVDGFRVVSKFPKLYYSFRPLDKCPFAFCTWIKVCNILNCNEVREIIF